MKIKEAVKKLLLVELPKNDNNISQNDRYFSIKQALESKEKGTEIKFMISIILVFDVFMTKFQREEPMIHLSHPNSEKLLKTIMARLIKIKLYTEKKGKVLKEVNFEDVNLQLNSDWFKEMQGKKHFLSFIPLCFSVF